MRVRFPDFLNYWYIWLVALVLLVASATGFRELIYFHVNDEVSSVGCWQLLRGLAVFLIGIGLVYVFLDSRGRLPAPAWMNSVYRGISLFFCVGVFVYMQVLYDIRLSTPGAYFANSYKKSDDPLVPMLFLIFLFLFVLAQLWFVVALIRALWRRS